MEVTIKKKEKLLSLETARCLAFLGIFLSHTDINSELLAGLGAWGVSVFLVLSGFLTIYNHFDSNKFDNYSFLSSIKYAIKKTRKIYPLHIITLTIMFIFTAIGKDIFQLMFLSFEAFLNALLIQEWFPLKGRSVYSVTWYLCTAVFAYFLTPYVVNKFKRKYSVKKAFKNIVFLFILQIALSFLGSLLPTPYSIDFLDYDLCNWFVYKFPLVRIIDFIIGCNLGYIFLHKKDNNVVRCNILEILSIVVTLFSSKTFGHLRFLTISNGGDQVVYNYFSWGYTTIFTIGTCLFVYYFAINKGIISNLLTGKASLYIAYISPYAYLIHNVVNKCLSTIVNLTGNIYLIYALPYFKITIGFVTTIMLSNLWIKHQKKRA